MNELTKSGNLPELTPEYEEAIRVHSIILANLSALAQGITSLGKNFKAMKEQELYKQLGYATFSDYTQEAAGMKERQARNYITVYETYGEEGLAKYGALGISKLTALALVDEDERTGLIESGKADSMSSRELEDTVKKLREKCEQLSFELQEKESADSGKENELKAALEEIDELKAALAEEKKTKVLPAPEMSAEERERIRAEAEKAAEEKAREEIEKANGKAREAEKSLNIARKKAECAAGEQKKLEKQNAALVKTIADMEKEKAALQATAKKPLPSSEKERVKVHLQIVLDNFNAAAGIVSGTADEGEKAALKSGLIKATVQMSAAAEGV